MLLFVFVILFLIFDQINARKPVISPFASRFSVEKNELFQLTCSVVQGTKPIEFQWFKDGSKLKAGSNWNIETKSVSSILTFESVQIQHSGNYSCLIQNPEGRDQSSTLLQVKGWFISSFSVLFTNFDRCVALELVSFLFQKCSFYYVSVQSL